MVDNKLEKVKPAAKPKRKKATKAESAARVLKIYEMLLSAVDNGKILQYAADKWGIGERQTYILINRAYEKISENADQWAGKEFGRSVARLNHLYQIGIRMQDYTFALKSLVELNKLLGLYAPKKFEARVTASSWESLMVEGIATVISEGDSEYEDDTDSG